MFRFTDDLKIICRLSFICAVLFIGTNLAEAQQTSIEDEIVRAPRISVEDTYQQVTSSQAVLVCAYEDETACSTIMLEGAISFKEFQSRLPKLKKDQPIIFYCA